MEALKIKKVIYKFLSLFSVVRGYNILTLVAAQYLAAIFIFSPNKSLRTVLFDVDLLFIVIATLCVVAAGYIINNFYDAKMDLINRPVKSNLDNFVKQETILKLYFLLNFLGFVFGFLISWRAALFFAVYIFAIWFYSHKLKKLAFMGVFSATMLTILPFFAVFIYFKNFSKVIFVQAIFLFLVIMVRELIKDLENIKGAIANNYTTFPVVYGERKTKQLSLFLLISTLFPVSILLRYPAIGLMRYYFYFAVVSFLFIGFYLWKSSQKNHYRILHNSLKILIFIGVFSLIFMDPSLIIEKVIERLY
jgi:4-hydroxybenzoate polyprenyltransferase